MAEGKRSKRRRGARVLSPEGAVEALQASPDSLSLRSRGLDDAVATALAAALPLSTRLHTLILSGNTVTAAGVAELAAALPEGVRVLNLSGNPDVGDAGAGALAEWVLRREGASGGAGGDAARDQGLPPVQLNLSKCGVGPAGAAALAGALPLLSRLNIRGNAVGDEGAAALATALGTPMWCMHSLQALNVANNGIGEAGASALVEAVRAGRCASLSEVALKGNPGVGEAHLAELRWIAVDAKLRHAPRTLDISGLKLGATGATYLAGVLRRLRDAAPSEIDLRSCGIDDEGAAALRAAVEDTACVRLIAVDLDSPEARRLAGACAANELRLRPSVSCFRSVSDRALGDEGATVVAGFLPTAPALPALGLHFNGIGEAGCAALAAALRDHTGLTELSLSSNARGEFWGAHMADALRSNASLCLLDLGGCGVGDAGAAALAEVLASGANTALTELHLDHCGVGAAGAAALAEAAAANSRLVSVWLHGADVDVDGTIDATAFGAAAAALSRATEANRCAHVDAVHGDALVTKPAAVVLDELVARGRLSDEVLRAAGGGAADVASASLAAYRAQCSAHAASWRGGQTVLATVAVEIEGALTVVALGVGTKFLAADIARGVDGAATDTLVRDSHAEVLARRAFLRFVHGQLALHLQTGSSALFESDTSGATMRLRLKPSVSLHMYTSLAPCGAASLGSADAVAADAASAGCLLVKGAGTGRGGFAAVPAQSARADAGMRLSCTDKMVKWQAVGMQGGRLMTLLSRPFYLQSITIGRHYDAARCEAALSTPVREFSMRSGPLSRYPGHAAECGESAADAPESGGIAVVGLGSGRQSGGDGDECLLWSLGDASGEGGLHRHDGRTGRPMVAARDALATLAARSPVCTQSLRAEAAALLHCAGQEAAAAAKDDEWTRAVATLYGAAGDDEVRDT